MSDTEEVQLCNIMQPQHCLMIAFMQTCGRRPLSKANEWCGTYKLKAIVACALGHYVTYLPLGSVYGDATDAAGGSKHAAAPRGGTVVLTEQAWICIDDEKHIYFQSIGEVAGHAAANSRRPSVLVFGMYGTDCEPMEPPHLWCVLLFLQNGL